MPQIDERQLKQNIKERNFARAYFIYGDEDYLKQFYCDFISKKCVSDGMEGFNLKKYDATDGGTFDEVQEASQTLPAFSGYACVVAHDFPLDNIFGIDKDAFSDFIKDIPETTVLIFWQDTVEVNLKKNSKYKSIVDLISKNGDTVCFDRMDRDSLTKILVTGASKRGCRLEKNTALYLIDTVGTDLTTLQNELEKLCNYKKNSVIENKDIDEICIKSLEANVFDLSRAIGAKNSQKAFAILEKLLDEKEKPELILGTLIAAYVDMYRAKTALEAGEKADFAAGIYNYKNKEFRLRNAARDCSKLSLSELCLCLDKLNSADQKLKTRVISEKIILEKLITELLRS